MQGLTPASKRLWWMDLWLDLRLLGGGLGALKVRCPLGPPQEALQPPALC